MTEQKSDVAGDIFSCMQHGTYIRATGCPSCAAPFIDASAIANMAAMLQIHHDASTLDKLACQANEAAWALWKKVSIK